MILSNNDTIPDLPSQKKLVRKSGIQRKSLSNKENARRRRGPSQEEEEEDSPLMSSEINDDDFEMEDLQPGQHNASKRSKLSRKSRTGGKKKPDQANDVGETDKNDESYMFADSLSISSMGDQTLAPASQGLRKKKKKSSRGKAAENLGPAVENRPAAAASEEDYYMTGFEVGDTLSLTSLEEDQTLAPGSQGLRRAKKVKAKGTKEPNLVVASAETREKDCQEAAFDSLVGMSVIPSIDETDPDAESGTKANKLRRRATTQKGTRSPKAIQNINPDANGEEMPSELSTFGEDNTRFQGTKPRRGSHKQTVGNNENDEGHDRGTITDGTSIPSEISTLLPSGSERTVEFKTGLQRKSKPLRDQIIQQQQQKQVSYDEGRDPEPGDDRAATSYDLTFMPNIESTRLNTPSGRGGQARKSRLSAAFLDASSVGSPQALEQPSKGAATTIGPHSNVLVRSAAAGASPVSLRVSRSMTGLGIASPTCTAEIPKSVRNSRVSHASGILADLPPGSPEMTTHDDAGSDLHNPDSDSRPTRVSRSMAANASQVSARSVSRQRSQESIANKSQAAGSMMMEEEAVAVLTPEPANRSNASRRNELAEEEDGPAFGPTNHIVRKSQRPCTYANRRVFGLAQM